MANEFHALGLAYRSGKARGYVVVRFVVSGNRVIREELVSPEPEAIHFAAARLRAACGELLSAAKADAELGGTPRESTSQRR